jgi:hypothetical protein
MRPRGSYLFAVIDVVWDAFDAADATQLAPVAKRLAVHAVVTCEFSFDELGAFLLLLIDGPALVLGEAIELVDEVGLGVWSETWVASPDRGKCAGGILVVLVVTVQCGSCEF